MSNKSQYRFTLKVINSCNPAEIGKFVSGIEYLDLVTTPELYTIDEIELQEAYINNHGLYTVELIEKSL